MRIGHVIDHFHTDVAYQEFHLALAQAHSGHTVRVISSGRRHRALGAEGGDAVAGAESLARAGVDVARLPSHSLGHDRQWLRHLEATITTFAPEVLHVHTPFSPTTVRAARHCRRSGAALLVDTHVQEAIAPGAAALSGRVGYRTWRHLCGPVLRRRVDAWVANGPLEARFLADRLAVPSFDIALEPLGFDPEAFSWDVARHRALRSTRGWEDDLVVAMTGKLHPAKGADLVATACERLHRERPVRLVLAGTIGSTVLRAVRAAAPMLVASGRLEVRPLLPRRLLADLFLSADVVVFPRLPSISIYEAAGTGARVLVGSGPFASWLHERHAGIEPVDPSDLAAYLPSSPDPSERAGRADAARAALSWASISASFVDRYRRALELR